jgi:hypothetical protein
VLAEQIGEMVIDIEVQAESGRAAHLVVEHGIDMRIVQERGKIRMDRCMRGNFIGMNPAKDQQVMIVGQVTLCPNNRAKPFIIIEKTKDSDQRCLGRKPVELGETSTRRAG